MSDSTTLEPIETTAASSPAISDLMNTILDAKLNDSQCYRLKSALNEITMIPVPMAIPPTSSFPKKRLTPVGVKTPRPESLSPEGKIILKKVGLFALLIAIFWWAVYSSITPTPTTAPAAATPATPASPTPAATTTAPPSPVPTPAAVAPAAPIAHHRRHQPAATSGTDTTTPLAMNGAPPAPVIDHAENRGSVLHMTWKSLGDGVRYKAYTASTPKLTDASSVYLFLLHRPYMDWTVSSVGAWRYAAITAIGKNGKESPMSNAIDTTAP